MLDLHEGILAEFAERVSRTLDYRGLHIRHLSTRTPAQRKVLTESRTARGLCLRCDARVTGSAARCEACRAKRRRPKTLSPAQEARRAKYAQMSPEARQARLSYLRERRNRRDVTP